jgi:cell division protein ZapA|tara:strand:- start:174 stop:527 length:354 start_codon:yes stop_codon:yes gene_type:complete
MAEVSLLINGKQYSLACDEGQEQRILDLGQYIDEKARDLGAGGGMSDNHRLMLTSLMLADELFETKDRLDVEKKSAKTPEADSNDGGVSVEETAALADAINQMAIRIEGLSARLNKA